MVAPPRKKTTIIVNQKPFHVEQETLGPAEIRALVDAPDNYEVWKVVKGADPEGQLPADDIQVTQPIPLHNGDKFSRDIAGTDRWNRSLEQGRRDSAATGKSTGGVPLPLNAAAHRNTGRLWVLLGT